MAAEDFDPVAPGLVPARMTGAWVNGQWVPLDEADASPEPPAPRPETVYPRFVLYPGESNEVRAPWSSTDRVAGTAAEALRGATRLTADEPRAAQHAWREAHPYLSALGDLVSGGATNPDVAPGPVDVAGAALPVVGGASKLGALYAGMGAAQALPLVRRALGGGALEHPGRLRQALQDLYHLDLFSEAAPTVYVTTPTVPDPLRVVSSASGGYARTQPVARALREGEQELYRFPHGQLSLDYLNTGLGTSENLPGLYVASEQRIPELLRYRVKSAPPVEVAWGPRGVIAPRVGPGGERLALGGEDRMRMALSERLGQIAKQRALAGEDVSAASVVAQLKDEIGARVTRGRAGTAGRAGQAARAQRELALLQEFRDVGGTITKPGHLYEGTLHGNPPLLDWNAPQTGLDPEVVARLRRHYMLADPRAMTGEQVWQAITEKLRDWGYQPSELASTVRDELQRRGVSGVVMNERLAGHLALTPGSPESQALETLRRASRESPEALQAYTALSSALASDQPRTYALFEGLPVLLRRKLALLLGAAGAGGAAAYRDVLPPSERAQ